MWGKTKPTRRFVFNGLVKILRDSALEMSLNKLAVYVEGSSQIQNLAGHPPTGTKRSQINKDVWRKLHDKKTRRLVFRFWSERKTRRLVFKFWSEVSGILLWRFRSTNLSIYLQGPGMSTLRGSNRGTALEGGAVERPPQGLPMFLNGLVVSLWDYSDKRNPSPHHALLQGLCLLEAGKIVQGL